MATIAITQHEVVRDVSRLIMLCHCSVVVIVALKLATRDVQSETNRYRIRLIKAVAVRRRMAAGDQRNGRVESIISTECING